MKFEVLNEKEFKPIELKITLESKQDLINMWCRYNLGHRKITELQEGNDFECKSDDYQLWLLLDDYLEKVK